MASVTLGQILLGVPLSLESGVPPVEPPPAASILEPVLTANALTAPEVAFSLQSQLLDGVTSPFQLKRLNDDATIDAAFVGNQTDSAALDVFAGNNEVFLSEAINQATGDRLPKNSPTVNSWRVYSAGVPQTMSFAGGEARLVTRHTGNDAVVFQLPSGRTVGQFTLFFVFGLLASANFVTPITQFADEVFFFGNRIRVRAGGQTGFSNVFIPPTNELQLATVTFDGGTIRYWHNGAPNGGGTITTTEFSYSAIIRGSLDAVHGEIICFERILSDSIIDQINTLLMA